MAEDKTDLGPPNRNRINVHEDYELRYWSQKLRCSHAELNTAGQPAGVMVKDVQDELNRTQGR